MSRHEWDGRPVIDADKHPELVPSFMSPEVLGNGAQPDDALSPHADAEIIEPPAWVDELDVGPGVAEARQALFAALREREAQRNEPEAGL